MANLRSNILQNLNLICFLLASIGFSACDKSKSTEGLSSIEITNKFPPGFKFPATYQGKPYLQSIQITENKITRPGNAFDQEKYFPILPFVNDFGKPQQWFPDFNPRPDPEYLSLYIVGLIDENETYWFENYSFENNCLYSYSKDEPLFKYLVAYGNYEKLYWYDNFININGNFLVIYRTKQVLQAEDVIGRLQKNYSEWLSPTGNNVVAIATYYTPQYLQK